MPTDGSGHLTPDEIASYLAGSVPDTDRELMERHMTACDSCRSEMVAGSTLTHRPKTHRWLAVALPTAAAAVLATLFLVPSTSPPEPAGSEASVLRGGNSEGVQTFDALQPEDGKAVSGTGLRFQWHSVQPGSLYDLTLMDDEGTVLWTGTSSDTSLTLPPGVELDPEETYYWYVDALLAQARSATTGIQMFSIER